MLTKPFGKITSLLHRFKVERLAIARIDLLIILLHEGYVPPSSTRQGNSAFLLVPVILEQLSQGLHRGVRVIMVRFQEINTLAKYGPSIIRADGIGQINERLGLGFRVIMVWLQEITIVAKDGRRAVMADGCDKEIDSSERLFRVGEQLPKNPATRENYLRAHVFYFGRRFWQRISSRSSKRFFEDRQPPASNHS